MPQLSIETFFSQIFWLLVILGLFYWLVVVQILPKFSETFKTRKQIELSTTDSTSKEHAHSLDYDLELLLNKSTDHKTINDFNGYYHNIKTNWLNTLKSAKRKPATKKAASKASKKSTK